MGRAAIQLCRRTVCEDKVPSESGLKEATVEKYLFMCSILIAMCRVTGSDISEARSEPASLPRAAEQRTIKATPKA